MSRAFHYTEQKINNHVSKLFLSSNSVTESKVFYEQEILLFINKIKNKPYIDDFSQFVESIASFEAINFPSGIVKEFFMLSNYFYDDCMSFFNDISKKMEIDDKLGALIIFLLNFERMENEDNNNSKEVASSQLLKIFKNNAFEKLLDEMIALKDIGEDKIKIEVRSDSFYAVFKLLEESKIKEFIFSETV